MANFPLRDIYSALTIGGGVAREMMPLRDFSHRIISESYKIKHELDRIPLLWLRRQTQGDAKPSSERRPGGIRRVHFTAFASGVLALTGNN
jgi:hypothetical protein